MFLPACKVLLQSVKWAKSTLDNRWAGLIQNAWDERPNPSLKARQETELGEVKNTLEFIHMLLN